MQGPRFRPRSGAPPKGFAPKCQWVKKNNPSATIEVVSFDAERGRVSVRNAEEAWTIATATLRRYYRRKES